MTTGRTLQPRRQGVILLLVLAMLAMFAMLIATFMVVSSQQYREADSVQKLDRIVHSPEDDMQSAVVEMLVGGNAKTSVTRFGSIAATVFGDANATGLVGTAAYDLTLTTNHLTDTGRSEEYYFTLNFNQLPNTEIDWLSNIGNIITFYDPVSLKWKSTRILDAYLDGSIGVVLIQKIPTIPDPSYLSGVDFFINPPAFTGLGVGYAPVNGDDDDTIPAYWAKYANARLTELDAADSFPYAVQLNPNAPSSNGRPLFGELLDSNKWSLNVDYTAPDQTSPFLGWFDMRFNPNGFVPNDSVIIPSYHRPSLVASYANNDPNTLRKLVMRPLSIDHPGFDGSNPPLGTLNLADLINYFSDAHGYYLDVDTDGDGIKDSVWVDIGLPVRTDENGRTYKPLVAVKCVDLDGKLNLNAIGSLAELWNTDRTGSGFGPAGINLARGLNVATTYVNGAPVFQSSANFDAVVSELRQQRYLGVSGEMIPRDDTSSALTNSILAQFAGLPSATPLYNYYGNLPDYWDQGMLRFDPLGNRFSNTNHSDMGFVPFALTTGAANGYWEFPNATTNAFATNPYMFDPNRRTPYDQPFTLPELEAILRQNDIDKDVMPERLRKILGYNNSVGVPREPEVLKVAAYNTTTLSNDVPVPGPALADQGYQSLYQLIRACVEKENIRNSASLTSLRIDEITLQLIKFLPDEIKQGGRINLNKLAEDPAMFLADLASDPAAYEKALYERMKMARGIYIILMALSYDKLYGVPDGSGGYIVEPYIEPSFLQADKIKKLYDDTATHNDALKICHELAATRLAQWAVNVVDFTDADAVMTPFIFDVNPFNGSLDPADSNSKPYQAGWGNRTDFDVPNETDGWTLFNSEFNEYNNLNASADYRLIWGMERPDLLLTETLASHDRRVADTKLGGKALPKDYKDYVEVSSVDGTVTIKSGTPVEIRNIIQEKYMANSHVDADFDQIRMPQGPAFLELYCAADPNRPYFPQEIYTGNLLDVSRVVTGSNDPVWRVVVGRSNYTRNASSDEDKSRETSSHMKYSILHRLRQYGPLFSFQPDNPDLLGATTPSGLQQDAIDEDRIVWFAKLKPSDMGLKGTASQNIYYNRTGNVGLLPNEYLVVGPRMETCLTSKRYGVGNVFGDVTGCPMIDLANLVKQNDANKPDFIGKPKYMVAAAEVHLSSDSLTENAVMGGATPTAWPSLANIPKNLWLGTGAPGSNMDLVGLGFSISEPLRSNYYTQPTVTNTKLNNIMDAYGALSNVDSGTGLNKMEESVRGSSEKPLAKDGLVGSGTAAYYKSAFLQRLADPMRAWNAITNPYITVDWNMFDLKVYTGEHSGSETDNANEENSAHLAFAPPLEEGENVFCSSQWGVSGIRLTNNRQLPNPWDRGVDVSNDLFTGPDKIELWTDASIYTSELGISQAIEWPSSLELTPHEVLLPYQPSYLVPASNGVDAGRNNLAFYQFPVHSLGRMGTDPRLMHPQLASQLTVPVMVPMSQAQANHLSTDPLYTSQYAYVNNVLYYGSPIQLEPAPTTAPESVVASITITPKTFQYLPWHNGPMANSYEVMQVPASAPGRFGVEFADRKGSTGVHDENYLLQKRLWTTVPDLTLNPATAGVQVDAEKRPGSLGSNIRFGHLLNFQHAHGNWPIDSGLLPFIDKNSQPITVGDKINIGSPFPTFDVTDTTKIKIARSEFVSLDLGNFLNFVNVPSRFVGTRDWYYDGNKWYSYSRFREPGKVNLNTLTASGFAALLENRPYNQTTASTDPDASYHEFDQGRGNQRTGDPLTDSFLFETPYRGQSSALLKSVDAVQYASPVDTTLLRGGQNVNPGEPLFTEKTKEASNAYTALEGIQRLSDMTTTRSNVFAVWMTLGYFEVERIQPNQFLYNDPVTSNPVNAPTGDRFNAIYPDGYMLKKEVGLETGEIERHRAFYIIDRSVPFGYRRGQKLNSEDAILLKRFIE